MLTATDWSVLLRLTTRSKNKHIFSTEHYMITFGTLLEFDILDTDYLTSELCEIDQFASQQLNLDQEQKPQPQQTYSVTSSPINLLSPDPRRGSRDVWVEPAAGRAYCYRGGSSGGPNHRASGFRVSTTGRPERATSARTLQTLSAASPSQPPCMKVFRTNFFADRQIKSFSNVSIQWLQWVAFSENISIQHAQNQGEKAVDKYFVDGYAEMGGVKCDTAFGPRPTSLCHEWLEMKKSNPAVQDFLKCYDPPQLLMKLYSM
ncbi:hypothetical protein F2P81_025592 [Scophthalmus maximus]|uniref:Uncharacterized protein n=1 Tax=Scophthalmus maximus TaxID=52904 RepID=A0A6A4RT15_SCOMX|nr:hypothetical protein F2P81_025592 [Scophthalmus maximus]